MAEEQLFLGLRKIYELSTSALVTDILDVLYRYSRSEVALEQLPVADLKFTASGHNSFICRSFADNETGLMADKRFTQ